jgi:hypothetical protein
VETPSPPDPKSKGNDYAIEALKQVLTLAGVILALTLTFLKEAVGEARGDVQLTIFMPIAWLLLIVVVWMAWVAIADAARIIGTSPSVTYAFAPRSRPRRWAKTAQTAFVAALVLLAAFATVNLPLYFRTPPSKGSDIRELSSRVGQLLQHMEAVGTRVRTIEEQLAKITTDLQVERALRQQPTRPPRRPAK